MNVDKFTPHNDINLLEILKCPICKQIMKTPTSILCDNLHTFCEYCITKWNKGCPLCNSKTKHTSKNIIASQLIEKLRLDCFNDGCKWTGLMENYNDHLAKNCDYEMVDCELDCGEKIAKKNMESHLLDNNHYGELLKKYRKLQSDNKPKFNCCGVGNIFASSERNPSIDIRGLAPRYEIQTTQLGTDQSELMIHSRSMSPIISRPQSRAENPTINPTNATTTMDWDEFVADIRSTESSTESSPEFTRRTQPRGMRGPIGPRGPIGLRGEQGSIGPTGPQGLMGLPGVSRTIVGRGAARVTTENNTIVIDVPLPLL